MITHAHKSKGFLSLANAIASTIHWQLLSLVKSGFRLNVENVIKWLSPGVS